MATVSMPSAGRRGSGASVLRVPRVDSRLAFGLLLVALSILGGLRLFAAADHRVGVLAAARDLPPNHVIEAGDFKITRVQLSAGVLNGLHSETRLRALTGRVLLYPVTKGGLVSKSAVGNAPRAGREITVPAAPEHALGGEVTVGDRVDVLATFDKTTASARTVTIVRAAEVIAVNKTKGLFGQNGGNMSALTLSVAPDSAVFLAFAMRNGDLDIVRSTGSADPGVEAVDRVSFEAAP